MSTHSQLEFKLKKHDLNCAFYFKLLHTFIAPCHFFILEFIENTMQEIVDENHQLIVQTNVKNTMILLLKK